MPRRVLILCTGNSCRSQIAEFLWRDLAHGTWEVHSAGSHPAGYVHPLAIEVLRELGLDPAAAHSKSVAQFAHQSFDLVVTVCDHARQSCPLFPSASQTLHWPFEDPVHATGPLDQRRDTFRAIRDQIAAKISEFLASHQ